MKKPEKNAVEWSVFILSAIIIVSTIAFLAMAAIREKKVPPELHVTTGAPETTHGGHRIEVKVTNKGDLSAEQVRIEVALRRGDDEIERAELDIIYVPRKSEREGWVTFRNDPRCCDVTTRAVSYEAP